jgi:hypothetical protein
VSTIPEEDNELDTDHHHQHQHGQHGHGTDGQCDSPDHEKGLARAVQVPNRIRRLRTRNVQRPKNLWFTGNVDQSFNSRCSKRFDTKDLEENAVHYYYYRSLPRLSMENNYTPSITSSVENIEPPRLPKIIRNAEDLLI